MKKSVIIGAGPAGLTAAYELLERTDIKPIVVEMSKDIGGISKTVNYKGNRIDIGGHRFFSKSDRVMHWWQGFLPVQNTASNNPNEIEISYHQNKTRISKSGGGPDPESDDKVMLVRKRLSRIYFLRKFFRYPVTLEISTLRNLGIVRVAKIIFSYCYVKIFRKKVELSLEDFFINRFGKELYRTFFKDYTEKVWGVRCSEINPEWGAQRIKGLSVRKALLHAMKDSFRNPGDISQKHLETSLIEQFLYPKYGPGQMWEEVAAKVVSMGGKVMLNKKAVRIQRDGYTVTGIEIQDLMNGEKEILDGQYFFSTMPVKDLVAAMDPPVPDSIKRIADGLVYRDFLTVGLLLRKLKVQETGSTWKERLIKDNWIYIQEPEVKIGRLQIFNNWSPFMVDDPENTVWMGLEYFCNESDAFWRMTDEKIIRFAIEELESIDLISRSDVIDSTLIRMPKTYPAYFGTYDQFHIIRDFLDNFDNLFLIGRNGMHKYNNADHSMLTAMTAVDQILAGRIDKGKIWDINTEESYHEQK